MTAIMGAATNPGQAIENLPSSIVGMASMLGRRPAGELSPAYGLTYRFKVLIDEWRGQVDLGKWSSCKGLKMRFEPVALRSGGDYVSQQYLPGDLTYEKIILTRAIEPKSSATVQRWIQAAAVDWIQGTAKPNPGGATISLLDASGLQVLTWHLQGVRPAAWSGPDLDATAGKVAIEQLELVHEGFAVEAGQPRGKQAPVRKQLAVSLSEKAAPTKKVQFINLSKEVTVDRTTESISLPIQSEGTDAGDKRGEALVGQKADTTKLTLAKLYIVDDGGVDVPSKIQQLLTWMSTKDKDGKELIPPELVVKWGEPGQESFERDVKLTGLNVTYVRFDAAGYPSRADVKLILTVLREPPPKGTNPTSGGIPGRRAHTLTMSEPLPLVAHQRYGNPAHWRDIAEANGIDDPLRARPGSQIFLPAPSELPPRGVHG